MIKKIKINSALAILGVVFTLLVVSCCPCRLGSSTPKLLDEGSSWSAVQMGSRSFDGEGYTLNFGADGVLSGQGDCNRIMGEWRSDATRKMQLSKLATTRAMCEDAKGEQLFIEALNNTDSYSIDGDKLLLLNKGSVVLIMERYE